MILTIILLLVPKSTETNVEVDGKPPTNNKAKGLKQRKDGVD